MPLEPRRNINQVRKAVCMAFGKTIAAKTFQLLKNAFCIILLISVCGHAGPQFFPKLAHQSFGFKSSHAPAQLICFSAGKPCGYHGYFHSLFLEQWHTEGSA